MQLIFFMFNKIFHLRLLLSILENKPDLVFVTKLQELIFISKAREGYGRTNLVLLVIAVSALPHNSIVSNAHSLVNCLKTVSSTSLAV
jgi:hypothetical protein